MLVFGRCESLNPPFVHQLIAIIFGAKFEGNSTQYCIAPQSNNIPQEYCSAVDLLRYYRALYPVSILYILQGHTLHAGLL